MSGKSTLTRTDCMPYIVFPAAMLMIAVAAKSLTFLLIAIAGSVLLNAPNIFRKDYFWTKRPRVVAAICVIPFLIFLFFAVDDIQAQVITILFSILIYGVVVVVLDINCYDD